MPSSRSKRSPSFAKFWCAVLLQLAVFLPQTALAYEQGDVLVRAGWAYIDPDMNSDIAKLGDVALGKLGADAVNMPMVTISYFATPHLALELILGAPPTFDISGTSGIINNVPIGSIEVIPLVVTAQYYPLDSASRWQPFVGIGYNYLIVGDVDVDAKLAPFFGADKIELDVENSNGVVLSLGVDFKLRDNLLLTFQAHYADVKAKGTAAVFFGEQAFNVDMFGNTPRAPILYSLSLGYIF